MIIGIIGNGYVGKATSILASSKTDVIIYDKDPDKCSHVGLLIPNLAEYCDFVFVCVPTPMNHDGSCSTLIVSKVVHELMDYGYDSERIIIRSTVPVGTSRSLGTMFMPEFLTEKNWVNDFRNQDRWILGSNKRNEDLRDGVFSIFKQAHADGALLKAPEMKFATTEEAELIKYVRNCFLATKVSFFNEIYRFCEAKEIDYDKVKELVVMDERVNDSHTQIPGPDGKFGFGGTCFPKDMHALLHQLNNAGLESHVVSACLRRNNNIDRPEKDWKNDKGRTVL